MLSDSSDRDSDKMAAIAAGKVWLISGCSSGFGASLALAVLKRGHQAIVTCRGDADKRLAKLVEAGAQAASLDVTDPQDKISAAVDGALQRTGRVDVLVNNAGYVLQGVAEELSEAEERAQYDTNVFGVSKLTRAVLPYLRKQRSGTVLNISSHIGRFARPGIGGYSASKFALEGYSEALYHEVKPLGIDVCVIEPGDFRTNVLEGNAVKVPPLERAISDYDEIRQNMVKYNQELSGKQQGDPERAAQVMIDLVEKRFKHPIPVRLALGSDACDNIRNTYKENLEVLEKWAEISRSTDFPKET